MAGKKLATFILVIPSIFVAIAIKNKEPIVDDNAIISSLNTGERNDAHNVSKH